MRASRPRFVCTAKHILPLQRLSSLQVATKDERTLDGHREQVDVLEGLDLVLLHQTAQLGDGHPFFVVVPRASAAPPAPAPAVTTSTTEAAPACEKNEKKQGLNN